MISREEDKDNSHDNKNKEVEETVDKENIENVDEHGKETEEIEDFDDDKMVKDKVEVAVGAEYMKIDRSMCF